MKQYPTHVKAVLVVAISLLATSVSAQEAPGARAAREANEARRSEDAARLQREAKTEAEAMGRRVQPAQHDAYFGGGSRAMSPGELRKAIDAAKPLADRGVKSGEGTPAPPPRTGSEGGGGPGRGRAPGKSGG